MFVALAKKYSKPNALNEVFEARVKDADVDKSDWLALLQLYLSVYNPSRIGQAESMIDKYKGKERQMFKAFAAKWYACDPTDDSTKSENAPKSTVTVQPKISSTPAPAPAVPAPAAPTASFGFGSGLASSLPSVGGTKPSFGASGTTESKPPTGFGTSAAPAPSPFGSAPSSGTAAPSPFGSTPAPATSSPFGSSSSSNAFGSTPAAASASPFGASSGTNTFGSTAFGAAAPSPSPFGNATSGSTFGQPAPAPSPSPFGQTSAPPAPSAAAGANSKFGGRNPRDMLYEFYKTYNPTKVNEVDKLMAKYAGNEEQLFSNLAKKYNKDPSIFGISATQTPTNTTPAFGSPAPLGGASMTGAGFGTTSPFGGAPSSTASAFGSSAGGGFGSSGGGGFAAAAAGGASFGSLASSSGGGFGAAAAAPSTGFGGFGGAAAPATTFGGASPFGAARR